MGRKTPAHSVSAINMYRQCPGKYRHAKVTKDTKYVQGAAAARGDVAHTAIESHIKHGTSMAPASVPESTKVAQIVRKLKSRGEVIAENEIVIKRDGSRTHGRDWDGAWFRFYVDVTWRSTFQDAARLIDWKTGKSKYLNDFQLEAYCIAESIDNPDLEVVRAEYCCLDEGASLHCKTIMDHETIAIRKEELFEEAMEIESAVIRGDLPYKKNFLCDWCDAKTQGKCEEWK
jgi:hypothetical protein